MSNGGSILCPDQFEEWEEEYEEWEGCENGESEAFEDYLKAVATAEVACVGAVLTVETIIGGIIGGAACGLTLWNMWDSADDWGDKIEECNEKAADSNREGEKYINCVNEHKRDP